MFQRRKTRVVDIGGIPLGGEHPIRVQTMTNLPTADIDGQVQQILKAVKAGAEYVRITVPTLKDVGYFRQIRDQLKGVVPLIADVHFSPKIAVEAAKIAAKVRINPGNLVKDAGKPGFGNDDSFLENLHDTMRPLLDTCREYGTALRIGTNHGSLSERILTRYGDTPEGMVAATMETVEICRSENFHNLVLALKSSNVKVMVAATRLLVRRMDESGMDYPIHLGVTEAGEGEDGRIKSAIGIGSLLADGIGDTIRVSLTEDPEYEIPVAYNILQAARARITKTEYISCPGCGRTTFNLQEAVKKVKEATKHLTGLKIAIMGCIVNGPGEMADADWGYVGAGPGLIHIYKGKDRVMKNVPEEEAIMQLIRLMEEKNTI